MKMTSSNTARFTVLAVTVLFAASGWLARALYRPAAEGYEVHEPTDELISPLLECSTQPDVGQKIKSELQERYELLTKRALATNEVSDVSIYFRDLNNGATTGTNEERLYTPASLLKVPLMMAIFRAGEDDPSVLSEKIPFHGYVPPDSISAEIETDPEDELSEWQEYFPERLIANMIRYSDNSAAVLLWNNLTEKQRDTPYKALGIKPPQPDDQVQQFMNVREMAAFFRVLYNASHISRQHSNQALKLLTETKFNNGLRAGVPSDIVVAHKFGIREDPASGQIQLHDCGIVYVPEKPYLLCVMTRGTERDRLVSTISAVSRETCAVVTSQTPQKIDIRDLLSKVRKNTGK